MDLASILDTDSKCIAVAKVYTDRDVIQAVQPLLLCMRKIVTY